jgi:hypothetical protein
LIYLLIFFLAFPQKETNPDYGFCEFFCKNFTKPISGLVRLNLSTRIRLNFRLARKALKSPTKPSRQPPARKTDGPPCLLNNKIRSSTKDAFNQQVVNNLPFQVQTYLIICFKNLVL